MTRWLLAKTARTGDLVLDLVGPIFTFGKVEGDVAAARAETREQERHYIQTVTMLSGGFIVTSLLWGTTLAHLIDGRIRPAIVALVLASGFALFGVIHSPLPSTPIVLPNEALRQLAALNRSEATAGQTPYHFAAAYALAAALLVALKSWGRRPDPTDSLELVRSD